MLSYYFSLPKSYLMRIIWLETILLCLAYGNEWKKYVNSTNSSEAADYINSKQTLWKARRNELLEFRPIVAKKMFYGAKISDQATRVKYTKLSRGLNIDIPEHFDARDKWPQCYTLNEIQDQSSCGSCWAVASASAMSDRICIATNGSIQVMLSAADLLSCCRTCGDGCHGGYVLDAWKYWKRGIVTGADYVSNLGCRPYPFPPCAHGLPESPNPACLEETYSTPSCERKCAHGYPKSYNDNKFYGQLGYVLPNDETAIQQEIIQYGPVVAVFKIYEDFELYEKGIYQHIFGKYFGGHAVKILGWGVENSTKFWRIANSWSSDWGENGYFRFIRGKNDCGIENFVCAGLPDLNKMNI